MSIYQSCRATHWSPAEYESDHEIDCAICGTPFDADDEHHRLDGEVCEEHTDAEVLKYLGEDDEEEEDFGERKQLERLDLEREGAA